MDDLAVCCFVTDLSFRGIERVWHFLNSLTNQKGHNLKYHMNIISQSRDKSAYKIKGICSSFKCNFFHSELGYPPIWNKGMGLNYLIKRAEARYIMASDIDNLYQDNFLSVVETKMDKDKIVLCHVHVSKPKHAKIFRRTQSIDDTLFQKIKKECKFFNKNLADGACQLASKDWFMKYKGYNEEIRMWGGMDNELHLVANISGLEDEWLDGETSIIHQYHDNCKEGGRQHLYYMKYGQKIRTKNIQIFKKLRSSKKIDPKRNKNCWGELFISDSHICRK